MLVALACVAYSGLTSTRATHNPPVASFSIDTDVSGVVTNTIGERYVQDPNGDGSPEDNSLSSGAVNSCIEVISAEPSSRAINIVGSNIQDTTSYQAYLRYDPNLVSVNLVNARPYAGGGGIPQPAGRPC